MTGLAAVGMPAHVPVDADVPMSSTARVPVDADVAMPADVPVRETGIGPTSHRLSMGAAREHRTLRRRRSGSRHWRIGSRRWRRRRSGSRRWRRCGCLDGRCEVTKIWPRRMVGVTGESIALGRMASFAPHPLDDLRWCEPRAGSRGTTFSMAERNRARDMRRRHARPGDRVVAATQPGRTNAYTRCSDRVRSVRGCGGEVRETRVAVVRLVGPTAWRSATSARHTVAVRHGSHGQRLWVGGGDVGRVCTEVPSIVASGHRVRHACGGRVAYGLVKRFAIASAE